MNIYKNVGACYVTRKLFWILPIVFGILLVPIAISAQQSYEIPAWVKGVAGFWVEDKISDNEFGEGLSFLIDNEIIKVPKIQ